MNTFIEKISKLKNITVIGNNLGDVENVSFDFISRHFHFDERQKAIVENWERAYINMYDTLASGRYPTEKMSTEDGKVVIEQGSPFHRMPARLDSLRYISLGGLVASEWYGISESQGEAPYCTFLDRLQEELPRYPDNYDQLSFDERNSYLQKYGISVRNHRSAFADNPREITFYFDDKNPCMKKLMSFDYFEYLKIRKESPEKIGEMYPKELVEFYELVIGASDKKFSARFHDDNQYETKSWMAIPLGIPPMLVNGICINSKASEDILEHLDEIVEMFPNATIFNENKEVMRYQLSLDGYGTK